jgi:pyridoxine/pyridoxamine 5'-phosphate oxidase
MDAGYGIPSEGSGADLLPWSMVEEWLTKSRNYWVSTASPARRPHAMPVWGLWLDGGVMFSTGRTTRKARNIAANPDVIIHLESGDDVCILEGRIEAVRDADVLRRFDDAYETKYNLRPDAVDSSDPAYILRPRVVLTWLEKDFPNTATRWTFR